MSTPLVNPLSAQMLPDAKQLAARLQSQHATSAAEEFEASLFGSVLEKMEKNLSIEDDSNSDAGHDTWGAMGVRAVSQALAQRHVLGIADLIEHSLGVKATGGAPGEGTPAAASPEKNIFCAPLKIPLKSAVSLPMNPVEGAKGEL